MTTKFYGGVHQLPQLFQAAEISGYWRQLRHGQLQFRAAGGGIFNFWPTTKTVNFQGKEAGARALYLAIMTALAEASPSTVKHARRLAGSAWHRGAVYDAEPLLRIAKSLGDGKGEGDD